MSLLRKEEELREIVSLVGAEILGDTQRIVFEIAKMVREYFLLQSAFHPIDMYCPIEKTHQMLSLILKFSERAKQAIDMGVPLIHVLALGVREDLERMKIIPSEEFENTRLRIETKMNAQFDQLLQQAKDGNLP
jgi:V/A-type H+-transporting ATPase subunit A